MIWQDCNMFMSPLKYALCISEKKFKKELKRLNVGDCSYLQKDTSYATTHLFQLQDGNDTEMCCIITIKEGIADTLDKVQINGILVHEAVHIWQEICEMISEENSNEFEAYFIQKISQNLFYSYKKLVNKKKRKK